jgi:hypothetical protein
VTIYTPNKSCMDRFGFMAKRLMNTRYLIPM